ncbi:unnamed protein product [Hyaloperonospora brassicae]|uniref:Temptin Cys/Cys disulfide domain-containing protein n=1 Tax=Hyaloperonospora brassicae TaxID=162125 RepID=A0AAV0TBM8_HYABA|nr:unnamed protein product [Hyaloperonospora brassicae]
MKLPLGLCTFSLTLSSSGARPSFVARIPNGNQVTGIAALGHVNTVGGGATNDFGDAFEAAGHEWTQELCQADSDSDGASNGQELGDPCCTWTARAGFDSSSSPATLSSPTHPGVANSFTESQLAAMVCGAAEAELDVMSLTGAASSIASESASGSLASSSLSSSQYGDSSGSVSDDGMAQKDQTRGFSGPAVDRTVPPPTTSDAPVHCSTFAMSVCFCFSVALALAAN